jgi:hypothetical protein
MKNIKMNFSQRWTNHLKSNNMTYREHCRFAVIHGLLCLEAGLLLIIHGLLPCFFEKAGSSLVMKLNKSFNTHRRQIKDCVCEDKKLS